MKKVIVDTETRTDSSGHYELLLKSTCPFCESSIYLARPIGECNGLVALHETTAEESCRSFDIVLTQEPHQLLDVVMRRAGKDELELFMARTGDDGKTLH